MVNEAADIAAVRDVAQHHQHQKISERETDASSVRGMHSRRPSPPFLPTCRKHSEPSSLGYRSNNPYRLLVQEHVENCEETSCTPLFHLWKLTRMHAGSSYIELPVPTPSEYDLWAYHFQYLICGVLWTTVCVLRPKDVLLELSPCRLQRTTGTDRTPRSTSRATERCFLHADLLPSPRGLSLNFLSAT